MRFRKSCKPFTGSVPLQDLVTILETLADHAQTTKDADVLTEYVRKSWSVLLLHVMWKIRNFVITIDPNLKTHRRIPQQTIYGLYPVLPPEVSQRIVQSVSNIVESPPPGPFSCYTDFTAH